ncbi:MAG: SRPBCC family protein [Asticcacaulis sp.]
MPDSRFVYATYIATTPEKVWEALITPEFIKAYFFGVIFDTDWKPGSPWKIIKPDGQITDAGEVLEIEPPHRLVLSWRSEHMPDAKAEGYSRFTAEIEAAGNATKLTITHEIDVENSKLIAGVSAGWPRILSNLKSLLETGSVVLSAK